LSKLDWGYKKVEAIKIRTDQAVSGMIVAADVYTPNDQLLITKGTRLDDRVITKLRFYNIYGLSVYKGEPQEESYLEKLRKTPEFKKFNQTYVETISELESGFQKVAEGEGSIDIDSLLKGTDKVLSQGRSGLHIFEMLHVIRDYDDMTYVHCLNVSLICNVFAGWLKMSKEETKILTLAGLFHDIGKMLVPREIITKAGRLTAEEFEEIKLHTVKGFQILKDLDIDVRVKYAALMHHERCDGSGYPNGFKSDQIENFSKIVAIADVYDAMTSNRIYRKAICPFDVVESFEKDGFLKFDPGYLMVFLERISQCYLHNEVCLNDGRIGEVVMINKFALSRPVIRCGDTFIDLSKEHDLTIESIL